MAETTFIDPASNAPDETYDVGTPTTISSTALAALISASYVPPVSLMINGSAVPVFRGMFSESGGTVVVNTANRTSQTVKLLGGQWYVQRGFTGLVAGGTVTDLRIGF